MCHARTDGHGATPLPFSPGARRRARGRTSWHSGVAAEDTAARHYEARGGTVRERRLRTPEGELDMVVSLGGILVFVEVKRRSVALPDSPVTQRQWRRLENAALRYMIRLQNETGVQPVCRFDVALVGPDGQVGIIENARSFDER